MNKFIYQFAFIIVLTHSSFIAVDETDLKQPYRLPKGVTAKDYLPHTLIVKYKNVTSQSIKTFGSPVKNQSSLLKFTYQKPIMPLGDLAQKTLSDQQKIDDAGINRIFELGFESDMPIAQVVNEVLKDPSIEYCEPRFIYHTCLDPNDVDYLAGKQNYLNQVKAPQAWGVQPNANGVVIAIVDSGSDLEHVDLANNIFFNTADPVNGIDDDQDGYIDNYRGWDFIGSSASNIVEDNNPDIPADSLDHGVHVSGLASAVTNNSLGIASIAQTAKMMILKVGADDNASAIYRGYDGIIYAANHGAKIISCSWGGPGGGAFGQDVINYAVSKGCLVVVAAGNGGNNEIIYPAGYKGAFAVANVKSDDVKSTSSSYGYHVSISSPGTTIYSTINRDRYGYKSGTSMATPIVSSAAALVLAKNPSLTGVQVGEILRLNTDDISTLNPAYLDQMGNGRLNVFKALNAVSTPSIRNQKITINDHSLGSLAVKDTLDYYFDLKNILQDANEVTVNLSSSNANVQILSPNLNTGAFAALTTKKIGPFKVVIKDNTPDNSTILFKLTYTAPFSSYQDKEFFNTTVNLDYQNIKVNQVYTTITSNGRVGFSGDNASNGLGFIYKDFSLLFEAALMVGNSPNKVSNNARGVNGVTDNHFNRLVRVNKITNAAVAYEGVAVSNDLLSPSPFNIEVKNRQVAYKDAPDDKYVLVEYELLNKSTAAINNVYAALFTDWDIDVGSKNLVRYDEGLKMGYTYASTPLSPFAGVKLLSTNANPIFYPMSYQVAGDPLQDGNFTIAEKFTTLSSGIKATSLGSGDGLDVMYVIGNGPYNIPVNGSVKLAFAFIAGDNLIDISNSAIAAQAKYTQLITSIPADEALSRFNVAQNFPNPAKQQTQISIDLPSNGKTSLEVFDLAGKKVLTVLNQDLKKGTHVFNVDVSRLNSGIYFYKTKFENLEKVMKMGVIK